MAARRSARVDLLACLRGELLQFVGGMAQPIGLAQRTLDLRAMSGDSFLRMPPVVPQSLDAGRLAFQPAESVEQPAMRRHVHQRAIIVLTVDLHQQRAQVFQHLHAHRLVVDEGAGAPVAKLRAAQDQRRPRRGCHWRRAPRAPDG